MSGRRIVLVDIGEGLTLSGILPSVALQDSYSARLVARGGVAPYTYAIVGGTLPAGLQLDPATGIVSGTATAAGSSTFTVRATDLTGASVQRQYGIAVTAEVSTVVISGVYPPATQWVAYSADLTISGGVPPYSNPRVVSGALPDGLALSIVGDKLRLSGTPTVEVAASFGVAVDSSDGQIATSAQTVAVNAGHNWDFTWTMGSAGSFVDVAYAPALGLLVAIDGLNSYYTSTDGLTWSARLSFPSVSRGGSYKTISWAASLGIFIVGSGTNGNVYLRSTDGISWTPTTVNGYTGGVTAWSPDLGLFTSTGRPNNTNTCSTSSDGVNWISRPSDGAADCLQLQWISQLHEFVSIASTNRTPADRIKTSADGITWVARPCSSAAALVLAYSPELGLFVTASKDSANNYQVSPDLNTWSPSGLVGTPSNVACPIAWSSDLRIFVTARSSDGVFTSTDGLIWTNRQGAGAGMQLSNIKWIAELGKFIGSGSLGGVGGYFWRSNNS